MVTPSVIFAFSVCRGRCAIVFLRLLAACAVMTALVCGCEKDDDDSSDDSSGISTNPATQLLGVWIGPAGTDQNETTVELSSYYLGSPGDDYAEDCGTLRWANGDHRMIENAVYNPPVLTFYLAPNGSEPLSMSHVWNATDSWELRYDGTSLSGTATKLSEGRHDGFPIGYYGVFMTRRP
jgi:hypothetical protein